MNTLKDAVFIIDGSSFLYRAYYSIRPLTTKDGIPVQAVFGFCRMIRKLIDTYNPQSLVVVWDSKGKTVRHEMYTEYKQTRQAAPSDLTQQKELIQEFVETIGIAQVWQQGIEADDLMYSIAKNLSQDNQLSVLVTSDKDLGQAVSDRVWMLDPFKEAIFKKEDIEQKYGFPLAKLPFYFALVGDSSDNIPGVAGIGPKGAQTLVTQFESLEQLYANLPAVSSARTQELLTISRANAFLSEQLFILRYYDIAETKMSFTFLSDNWQKAYPLFSRLGFTSLLRGVEGAQPAKEVTLHTKYKFVLVDTIEELNLVAKQIKEKGGFALDTEGTSLNPLGGYMVGMSICVEEGVSYYIPFEHATTERQLTKEQVFEVLKPLLEDASIKKYLHHAKFDALMFRHAGIILRGIHFDTMIAASLVLLDGQSKGLKALSECHLQEPMFSFADIVKKNKYKDFSQVPLGLATNYAAADAHQTMRLMPLMEAALKKEKLDELFFSLEMPLMNLLIAMEERGIYLDRDQLRAIDVEVSKELACTQTEIIDLIGQEYAHINLNSPKQLEELLFTRLQLPPVKKTTAKTGYSTDVEVLEVLAKIHPVPGLIMKYRELFKLKSTYLDALGTYVNPDSGRIHTTYNQTAVATGRLASSEPNLQNIPVDKFSIRAAFKPASGCKFLSADYSQIELRVLAFLSQDQTLLTAFKEGKDIHSITAAGLFDLPVQAVTSEQRSLGKRINFSILYGLTAHGLAKDLDISHTTAKNYIDRFMAQYPGVVAWMDQVIEKTKQQGYVETLWGRRRALPGIYEKNRTLYDLARRVAINTAVQGTAAELMKLGMITLEDAFKKAETQTQILLQIHDELLIEVPETQSMTVEAQVKNILESIVSWNVPLVVTTRTGNNWQEITK